MIRIQVINLDSFILCIKTNKCLFLILTIYKIDYIMNITYKKWKIKNELNLCQNNTHLK